MSSDGEARLESVRSAGVCCQRSMDHDGLLDAKSHDVPAGEEAEHVGEIDNRAACHVTLIDAHVKIKKMSTQ
jgi:hypothetical protein